jgi:thymidylate kinase
MIALVGGDGAGKSTVVEGLCEWLSPDREVTKIHLGKPPWSWTTTVVRSSLKLTQVGRDLLTGARLRPHGEPPRAAFPTFARVLRQLCVARDRRLAYEEARRLAADGHLVICDRFPLPEIKLMDGPLLDSILGGSPRNRIARFLIHLEETQYRSIAPPEVLIVLRVDPEIAARRRLEAEPSSVRARSREIWECEWRSERARVVDANQPSEKVLAAVKSIVWAALEPRGTLVDSRPRC